MSIKKEIKVVELFAGVGGFHLGLKAASAKRSVKYKVVWFNQWEPATKEQHAWKVYVREFHWDKELKYKNTNTDIGQVKVSDIPDFDLLVGGFPCQDYSVARPLNQADGIVGKKGVLWWQIERLIREKANRKKAPSYLMLENVDRLLKSPAKQRGRDFALMLASLANLGYIVEWRVINAAEYGMPQRRRRVFLMGYHPRTAIFKQIKKMPDPFDWVLGSGLMSKAFPVRTEDVMFDKFALKEDLVEITNKFSEVCPHDPFENAGIMVGHTVYTRKVEPNYQGKYESLGKVLIPENEVPEEFFINEKDLERWKYLKGPKHEERTTKAGHVYHYDEGGMVFPDSLDKPSRTIITSEGGSTPSRFKHVVNQGERLRRLTPVELEKLNGFPPDHTRGLPDTKRAFMMGNALVVGIVKRLGIELGNKLAE